LDILRQAEQDGRGLTVKQSGASTDSRAEVERVGI
jgi:hypothetical protein